MKHGRYYVGMRRRKKAGVCIYIYSCIRKKRSQVQFHVPLVDILRDKKETKGDMRKCN